MIAFAVAVAGFALFWLVRDPEAVRSSSLDESDFKHFDIGGIPRSVTTTSDGVWVGRADRSVIKVDPRTGKTLATVRLPFLPGQMVATEGTVWIEAIEGTSIARLDPLTAKLVDEIEVGTTPQSLAVAEDGVLVAAFDDGVVKRLDTTSGEVADEILSGSEEFPSSVAAGFGAVWISDVVDDVVTRVGDESGSLLEVPVGDSPTQVITGEGAVWVANFNARSVSRIDPDDPDEPVAEILVGGKPGAMAVGAGYVLVLRPSTDSLVLIDAEAGRWTGDVYALAEAPQDIVAGHGFFWIAGQDGTLTRVPHP